MQVARKIVDALLQQIEAERRGNAVDRRLLADVLRMLDALGLYTEAFEQPFHEQTELFYAAEGASGLSSMEVPEYLIHAEVRSALTHAQAPSRAMEVPAQHAAPGSALAVHRDLLHRHQGGTAPSLRYLLKRVVWTHGVP